MRKNFALIGCGEVARKYHLQAINSVGGTIIAACDPDVTAFETTIVGNGLSCYWYKNYIDLLDTADVDFVSICTPNYLHVPIALYALNKGKKVILEKPVGITLDSIQELINHPRSNEVAVCYQRRFSEQALDIKKDTHKPVKVTANIFVRRDAPYWNEWRRDKTKSGGANLINIDVHYLDLIQWWLGGTHTLKFAKTAARTDIDQSVFARLDFNGTDVEFLGDSLHDDRKIWIEIKYDSGHKLYYTEDTGSHDQVYQAFLAGKNYVTPQEAAISVRIALDIYQYDKTHQ